MKPRFWLTVVCGLSATASALVAGETLRQWSTIDALLKGYYDGVVTIGQARQAGDFGLGTLEGLDGELMIYQDRAYQIDITGRVNEPADTARSPFVAVTHFQPDLTFTVPAGLDMAALQKRIEAARPSPNYIYAVRITGGFSHVKTRSVPKQSRPYPPLAEAAKHQREFSFTDVKGVMVGFDCPTWIKGINVPGHHYHFLTQDHSGGGHVLGLVTGDNVKVEMDLLPDFAMQLPQSKDFGALDLSGDQSATLHAVESERK